MASLLDNDGGDWLAVDETTRWSLADGATTVPTRAHERPCAIGARCHARWGSSPAPAILAQTRLNRVNSYSYQCWTGQRPPETLGRMGSKFSPPWPSHNNDGQTNETRSQEIKPQKPYHSTDANILSKHESRIWHRWTGSTSMNLKNNLHTQVWISRIYVFGSLAGYLGAHAFKFFPHQAKKSLLVTFNYQLVKAMENGNKLMLAANAKISWGEELNILVIITCIVDSCNNGWRAVCVW